MSTLQRRLHSDLEARLRSEVRPPKPPHITFVRFRKRVTGEAARDVEERLGRHTDSFAGRTDRLTHVRLVRSTLTPAGPIYEPVDEAKSGD